MRADSSSPSAAVATPTEPPIALTNDWKALSCSAIAAPPIRKTIARPRTHQLRVVSRASATTSRRASQPLRKPAMITLNARTNVTAAMVGVRAQPLGTGEAQRYEQERSPGARVLAQADRAAPHELLDRNAGDATRREVPGVSGELDDRQHRPDETEANEQSSDLRCEPEGVWPPERRHDDDDGEKQHRPREHRLRDRGRLRPTSSRKEQRCRDDEPVDPSQIDPRGSGDTRAALLRQASRAAPTSITPSSTVRSPRSCSERREHLRLKRASPPRS